MALHAGRLGWAAAVGVGERDGVLAADPQPTMIKTRISSPPRSPLSMVILHLYDAGACLPPLEILSQSWPPFDDGIFEGYYQTWPIARRLLGKRRSTR